MTEEQPQAEGHTVAEQEPQIKDLDKFRENVQRVLQRVRPYLQGDGGDVELVDVEANGNVNVHLTGACAGCPLSQLTISNGVERILKEHVPGVAKVVPVNESMPVE